MLYHGFKNMKLRKESFMKFFCVFVYFFCLKLNSQNIFFSNMTELKKKNIMLKRNKERQQSLLLLGSLSVYCQLLFQNEDFDLIIFVLVEACAT